MIGRKPHVQTPEWCTLLYSHSGFYYMLLTCWSETSACWPSRLMLKFHSNNMTFRYLYHGKDFNHRFSSFLTGGLWCHLSKCVWVPTCSHCSGGSGIKLLVQHHQFMTSAIFKPHITFLIYSFIYSYFYVQCKTAIKRTGLFKSWHFI